MTPGAALVATKTTACHPLGKPGGAQDQDPDPEICENFPRISGPEGPLVLYWPLGDFRRNPRISVLSSCIFRNGAESDTCSTQRGADLSHPEINLTKITGRPGSRSRPQGWVQ